MPSEDGMSGASRGAKEHAQNRQHKSKEASRENRTIGCGKEGEGAVVAYAPSTRFPEARISASLRLKSGMEHGEVYDADIKKVAEKMIERALRDALSKGRT